MPQHELVLNFHGIGEPHPGVGAEERPVWLSRSEFLNWLDRIDELRTDYGVPVRITFDDGNWSDLSIALPGLRERDLTATFFVCAGRLRMPAYLDRSAVRDLVDAGMEIGSHGMHHRNWRTLDNAALEEEIGTARKMLEDASGRPVEAAGIPFGSYNRRVLKRLSAEGFTRVYTSDRGFADQDAWLKPRNTLRAKSTAQDLSRLLEPTAGPQSLLRAVYRLYKTLR